jgi:two-component system LytT family sensor kinase
MHPYLRSAKQFLMVGLLWSPLCFWMVFLLGRTVEVTWWEAAIWALPPMGLELLIILSTWYLCRMTSQNNWYMVKIIWTHISAALILNGLWLFLIMLYSSALDLIFKTETWKARYGEALPVFFAVGLSLYFIGILAHYLVLAVEKNRKIEEQVLKQSLLTSQAELKALKATVHPHFLFNSLNLLGPLMRTSKEKAQTVVSQLSDFLLYSLRYGKRELVTVQDELDHINNYLGIESVRLGERLHLQFDIDETVLDANILPLTLLPLVENAVKHGIGQCIEGGTISITIKNIPEKDSINITITNPFDEPSRPMKGEGMGLKTLKQRIDTFHAGHGRLQSWKDGHTFTVELEFPKPRRTDQNEVKNE